MFYFFFCQCFAFDFQFQSYAFFGLSMIPSKKRYYFGCNDTPSMKKNDRFKMILIKRTDWSFDQSEFLEVLRIWHISFYHFSESLPIHRNDLILDSVCNIEERKYEHLLEWIVWSKENSIMTRLEIRRKLVIAMCFDISCNESSEWRAPIEITRWRIDI